MPSEDYTPTVRGSLKLKGSTPSGITKKKKKKDKSKLADAITSTTSEKASHEEDMEQGEEKRSNLLRKEKKREGEEGEQDEELTDAQLKELETRDVHGDGKTASERQYEEMRRKRVCRFPHFLSHPSSPLHRHPSTIICRPGLKKGRLLTKVLFANSSTNVCRKKALKHINRE